MNGVFHDVLLTEAKMALQKDGQIFAMNPCLLRLQIHRIQAPSCADEIRARTTTGKSWNPPQQT